MEDMADFRFAGFVLGYGRPVNKGSSLLAMADVALFLKDTNGGENGVIRERVFFGHGGYRSPTADSPRCHSNFISLNSASVSVMDFFGGIFKYADLDRKARCVFVN